MVSLLLPLVDIWKVTTSDPLQDDEVIVERIFLELFQLAEPFLLDLSLFKVVLFGWENTISMLYQKAKMRFTLLSHYCESFESYDVEGNLGFGVAEHKDSGSNELEVDFLVILLVELPRFSLDVGSDGEILRLCVIELPDVGVEAWEIDIEEGGMIL